MAAVQETVDRVRSVDVEAYKYGFVSPIEFGRRPQGVERGHCQILFPRRRKSRNGFSFGGLTHFDAG